MLDEKQHLSKAKENFLLNDYLIIPVSVGLIILC